MKAVTCLLLLVVLVGVSLASEEINARTVVGCPLTCQFGIHFTYPHLSDCNRFYRCLNGQLLEFTCSGGSIFDIETLRCRSEGRCVLPAL